MNALSAYLDGLLRDLSSYFAHSIKRLRDFTSIQDDFNMKHLKMPNLSKIRWLSREKVITTLLEQYDVFVLYFQSEVKTDKVDGAKRIYV